jgi:hypothetical protein
MVVHRLLALLGVAGLALAAVALSPATPAHAQSNAVQVFVGYADTFHGKSKHFPTPWAGSPNVIFQGCQPKSSCVYDTGAARLVNNTSATLTINSVVITFDTCVYDIWPHETMLPPGKQLIVTSTASGHSRGCTPQLGLMDSSDIGPGGSSWVGHCTNSGIIPQVAVTINGVRQVFLDTGQVLNTGGIDKALCPAGGDNESKPQGGGARPATRQDDNNDRNDDNDRNDGNDRGKNESAQWTQIGSVPCTAATLTLAPATQTHPVGATATVLATLLSTCGTPVAGATVNFAVLSGPNVGGSGTGTTDASGMASFSYSSGATGTDVLRASATTSSGTITSNTVTVIWVSGAMPLMTGRAFAVSSSGLVNIPPTPDTGPVSTTTASTVAPPCVVTVTVGPVNLRTLCASVTTATIPTSTSTATSSVDQTTVGAASSPVIDIVGLHSSSTTTCAGSSGQVGIVSLSVGGAPISVSGPIAPNTTVTVLGVTLILNEQIPVPGGLTVNALHVIIPTVVDLTLASSTSDIHNC